MAATANTNQIPLTTTTTTTTTPPSPPWIQAVRGPEPDPIAIPSSPKVVATENPPLSAWNKKLPANLSSSVIGVESESDGAPVSMMMDLWPALSECTKTSPKVSSSGDSSNFVVDFGSIVSPQVADIDTSSRTTVPSVRSPSSTAQKPSHSNHHPTSNYGQPGRQKSMKYDGEATSQANGVLCQQSSQPANDGSNHQHTQTSPKPNSGGSENFGKDNVQNHRHRESAQRNSNGEHPHNRNSFKRGNGGSQSRGDGSHQTYGGRRRDQERGNHDWNHQKSFNGRDASLQPSVVSRGFVRPPSVATPFVHHPAMQPFINPAMPDVPIFFLPPGMQFVAPVPHMYFSAPDPELYSEIMKQINYYFSNENLVRDTFLRERMDENGWVSVDVISKFNRVKNLTTDTFQILEAIRASSVVEVQGDKIRRRDDWMRWILPSSVQIPTLSDSQSPKGVPPVSAITDHIQSFSLKEKTNDPSYIMGAVSGSSVTQQTSLGDSTNAPQTNVVEATPGVC